jgi:hypothetical protein
MNGMELVDSEWVAFPGGELEGRRPAARCPACRLRQETGGPPARTICFQCYRGELERGRRLKAAARLDTGSDARFQEILPFEPVDRVRLARLQTERAAAGRALVLADDVGSAVERRRRAQIAARHAVLAAIHAAELQLPESWLPFVVAGRV